MPEVIDLTGEDDEEDHIMEPTPPSPKDIHPEADTSRPQPEADPAQSPPHADAAKTASTPQGDKINRLPYDACFGLVSIGILGYRGVSSLIWED